MNIFINSPGYYTNLYGVDDEVYKMCSKISKNMDLRNYTEDIDTFAVTPIISPNTSDSSEDWKQEIRVSLRFRMASISIHSNFDDYFKADAEGKKQMIWNNIERSAEILKRKLKAKFDLVSFVKDLHALTQE